MKSVFFIRMLPGKCGLLVLALCLCCFFKASAQKTKAIRILHADEFLGTIEKTANVQRYIGHVAFRHEEVTLHCDSAWMYPDKNLFQAFGHVVIRQQDTLTITGDSLRYEGNSKTAYLYHNVQLHNKTTHLQTEQLIYDVNARQARYFGGGVITDKDNRLTSKSGTYDAALATYFFKDSVKLYSRSYEITTDTLRYNTRTHIATFLGPTWIKGDGNTVYCEDGWYDTRRDRLRYQGHVSIRSGKRMLKGDSLFYDKILGIGKIFRNVEIRDTSQHTIIRGDYAEYRQRSDSSFITGKALLMMVMDEDTLFLHGDTLCSVEDSTTGLRTLYAYRHVKFFKSDMQGRCDSLIYRESDSTISLYGKPVLWSEENQITAEKITMRLWEGKVRKAFIDQAAFIVSQEDSMRFNQVKGRNMTAFFADNTLKRILVNGNGQTIYYGKDSKGSTLGVNRADCSDLIVQMGESEVREITFITKPDATLYPIHQLHPSELMLNGFQWLHDQRPYSKNDIFQW